MPKVFYGQLLQKMVREDRSHSNVQGLGERVSELNIVDVHDVGRRRLIAVQICFNASFQRRDISSPQAAHFIYSYIYIYIY